MFGSLGVFELLLIFVVILVVFGPRRIPEIGKTLGKALGEFRKATDDLKNTIEREVRLEELKSITPNIRSSVESIARIDPFTPTDTTNPVSRTEPVTDTPAPTEITETPGATLRPEPDYLADPDGKRPEST